MQKVQADTMTPPKPSVAQPELGTCRGVLGHILHPRDSDCVNWRPVSAEASETIAKLRAEVERLTGERDRLREALMGMVELEKYTHRLPGVITQNWLNGIVDDARAALKASEDTK